MDAHPAPDLADPAVPRPAVILGETQPGTRAGVRRALESGPFRVVAETCTANDAVAAAIRHRPDVCLLAVHLPGNGISAAERIKAAVPGTKIVMLTESDRDDDLIAAVRAGADGYLLKTTSAARLPKAIEGVLSGEAAIPRRLVARLIHDYRNRGQDHVLFLPRTGQPVTVTSREFDVIIRLRESESTAEIARDLRISEVTVRRHISSIEHKLGVSDRRALLALVDEAELDLRSDPGTNCDQA
jgi:DNA-binding NarL/FixJ family response regulator